VGPIETYRGSAAMVGRRSRLQTTAFNGGDRAPVAFFGGGGSM
jgi:hypothetical protein